MKKILLVFILLASAAQAQVVTSAASLAGIVAITNSSVGGTALYGPAKTTGSPPQAVRTSAGDTDANGICIQNCGTSGVAIIATGGQTMCVFDGSVTAADWVQISSSVAGECHDAGASRPTFGKLLGVVVTTAVGAGTYAILQSDMAAIGAVQTDSTGLIDPSLMPTGVIPFPSGAMIMILSGTCPSSFTEVTALNGQFLEGTIAANGDVGGTGGNSTITPAGTVSTPTFSGASDTTSAVSAGTPAGSNGTTTTGATSAGTPAGTNAGTTTTGACGATVDEGTTSTAKACTSTPNLPIPAETFTGSALATHTHTVPAETFTGSALGTHTHTVTPTGTVSQPTFTGNSVDPRPPFTKVIFCSKN